MKPFKNPMTTIGSLKINNVSGGASINFGPAFHKGHQANAKIETGEIVIGDEFTINIGCPEEEENDEENNNEENNDEDNGENDEANNEENDEKEHEFEFEYSEKVNEDELEYSEEEDEHDFQPKKDDLLQKKKWKWVKGKFKRVE